VVSYFATNPRFMLCALFLLKQGCGEWHDADVKKMSPLCYINSVLYVCVLYGIFDNHLVLMNLADKLMKNASSNQTFLDCFFSLD
jgi:hypothetical protein